MSQSKGPYGRVTDQVLAFMQNHPGGRFTVGEVGQQIGCPLAQTRIALELLARDGVIDREQPASGADHYVYHPG